MDDLTCYYRMVCRDYLIDYCGWNVITNYHCNNGTQSKFGSKDRTLLYLDITPINIKKYAGELTPEMRRDASIEAAWDIECNRHCADGNIPDPQEKRDKVFMIGITFAFYHSEKSFLRLCIQVDQLIIWIMT